MITRESHPNLHRLVTGSLGRDLDIYEGDPCDRECLDRDEAAVSQYPGETLEQLSDRLFTKNLPDGMRTLEDLDDSDPLWSLYTAVTWIESAVSHHRRS